MAKPVNLQSDAVDRRSTQSEKALTKSNAEEFVKPEPVNTGPNIIRDDNASYSTVETLTGTAGVDYFVFDLALTGEGQGDAAYITGFETGVDQIHFVNTDNVVFGNVYYNADSGYNTVDYAGYSLSGESYHYSSAAAYLVDARASTSDVFTHNDDPFLV